jgi:hypothetical protein
MSISVDEAEKIATDFVQKKRSSATQIEVKQVTRLTLNKVRVSGTYKVPDTLGVPEWEVVIRGDKTVIEYKFP